MDRGDISAIFPVAEQPEPQQTEDKPHIQEVEVYISRFPTIYYGKKFMKDLLQQRSISCQSLGLKLKKDNQQISLNNMCQIINHLFDDGPSVFDSTSMAFVFSSGATYGFFSTDGKFIPLCKKCNLSTYALITSIKVKIICSNPKCKMKLLVDCPLGRTQTKNFKKQKINDPQQISNHKKQASKDKQYNKPEKPNSNRVLTLEEMQMIKKTTRKLLDL